MESAFVLSRYREPEAIEGLSPDRRGVKLGKFPKFGKPGNESRRPAANRDLSSDLNPFPILVNPKWFGKLGWWKEVRPGLSTESAIFISDIREGKEGGRGVGIPASIVVLLLSGEL